MYIFKNKMLFDSDGLMVKTVNNEVLLTADIIKNIIYYPNYVQAIASNLSIQIIRLYLLNPDETPLVDVSEYLLSGNLSYNYQNGQTHSLNISLYNSDGYWKADPVKGNIWRGSKFRLDIGLFASGNIYWRQCGIFVTKEINIKDDPDNTVDLQLFDKFALMDGTIGGTIENELVINVGTNLKTAIEMCLNYSDEFGNIFDTKKIIFEQDLSNIVTPYTITKTSGSTVGEVLIELAEMVSNDVFYNPYGNLTLRKGVDEVPLNKQDIVWHYREDELLYSSANISINAGEMINKFIVKGTIENGKQTKGIAINKNPYSPINVMLNPVNSKTLEDDNINVGALAQERAEYELQNCNFNYLKQSFTSVFVPHLQPKNVISWTNKNQNIINERYVITGISFSLGQGSDMQLELAKVQEV